MIIEAKLHIYLTLYLLENTNIWVGSSGKGSIRLKQMVRWPIPSYCVRKRTRMGGHAMCVQQVLRQRLMHSLMFNNLAIFLYIIDAILTYDLHSVNEGHRNVGSWLPSQPTYQITYV